MRHIVVDFARRRLRERARFESAGDMDLDRLEAELVQARQFVALDDALADLARVDERKSRVVDCRFFGGLSEDETAQALGIGLRTVQREWNAAREWLAEHMRDESEDEGRDRHA
jgi:RNA polymerase sigma-70 factor, ECF subfamily